MSSTAVSIHDTRSLQGMASTFQSASTGLFGFTALEITSRHNGVYAFTMARPSKRMQTALSVHRELLVLFSAYGDQQHRTVVVAKELIAEKEGRLEASVAVIVHKDKDGNDKLKKWGRDAGVAILPIYVNECPANSEGMERLLSDELFSHDPFDVTGPVSDDENFYGRRNEAQDLARKLQLGQIHACFGIRKIGKTSLLNRVIGHVKLHHDCYSVMLDCSRDDVWSMSAAQLMSALAAAVESSMGASGPYFTVGHSSSSDSLPIAASKLQLALNSASRPVIVFIDEVDYITPASPTQVSWSGEFNAFWRNFRAIYQECCRGDRKFSILISGVSSRWFSVESIDGIENAALSFVPEEYLNPLARDASIAMIRKLARAAGLTFNDQTAGMIASACSNMPFWIRKACSYMHRYIDIGERPLTPDEARVGELLSAFVLSEGASIAQLAVRHLFRVYAELEEPCLRYLLETNPGIEHSYANVLEKYGIVSIGPHRSITGTMMREGLRVYLEERTSGSFQPAEPKANIVSGRDDQGLGQWAEELALINRTRNMLEKKLRQVVLNIVRADVMTNKRKETAKARLLSGLPSSEHAKYENLSADQLIEKFTWKQLTELIGKDWALFQTMFADKRQFVQHAEIINERFDAHAKDFDEADFALYRRSIKWMDDRIASV